MLAVRLGLRNLARHRWRTGLTLAGVALSVGLMVWSLAFIEGWMSQMVRGATAVDTGQLQLQTAGWAESPRPYHAFEAPRALLDSLEAVEGVRAVSPRVELYGIVGHELRSQVGRIVGVDPRAEARATPIVDAVVAGRWLSDDPAPFPVRGRSFWGRPWHGNSGWGSATSWWCSPRPPTAPSETTCCPSWGWSGRATSPSISSRR